MKLIIRDRARATVTQFREDIIPVAPTIAHLLRVIINCVVPTSRAVTVRAYHAWRYALAQPGRPTRPG